LWLSFDFAKKRSLPENEVIDLLLHATHLAFFDGLAAVLHSVAAWSRALAA
jgi:hypothetical protein